MGSLTYAEQLEMAGRLTETVTRQAIEELAPHRGSAGLDVGCGNGRHSLWLAEAIGTGGKVTGLDISPENLSAARERMGRSRFSDRVEFVRGDLLHLPLKSDSLDWVWCADTLWTGFITDDAVSVVRNMSRAVKPGGMVALFYWSSQTFLPGYPALEARLNKAFAETTRYLAGIKPEQHHMRALAWLEAAGLEDTKAKSFMAEFQAPFSKETREGLAFCFSMFWGELEEHLSSDDWKEYQRICDPESADFILNDPGYYAFLTYTIFYGHIMA